MSAFVLDPRLAADTLPLGDLALSRLLLMNDARFPWLVLVPMRPGARELFDLAASERAVVVEEACAVGRVLAAIGDAAGRPAEKINIAALGNIVRQLHVHVVARFSDDAAWPAPVFGHGVARPYAPAERARLVARLGPALLASVAGYRPAVDS